MDEQNDNSQEESWLECLKRISKETIEKDAKILDQRYKDCDEQKHPDYKNGYCTHCYRRQHYTTPRTDEQQEFRRKLRGPVGILHQPMDAPKWKRKREEEISLQERDDWFYGLDKIEEELKGKQETNADTDSIDNKLD